jgi:hypothetical protein
LESRFDSGTTPSFLVFDVTGPLAYTIPITDHPMATTTIWNISQLERHTADGIVFTAHYTVDANDGTYSAGAYGSIGLDAPEDNVIPFASTSRLRSSSAGCRTSLNVEEIEAALQKQLDEQRAPSVANGVPWS